LIRDQELRFTVHDSPDYYQLKVSVFNDDKKTDLIGETWVNLQEVVVPGGGQNDIWHNLSCKGKYAGEIRIEITYYDTRPKQEKSEKSKQAAINGVDDGSRDSLKGPRQPKATVKRRPLPSDPVTGAPAPTAIPDHIQTPPRGYQSPEHVQTPPRGYQTQNYISNQSPLQNVEYNTPPPRFLQEQGYESYGNSPDMNGYGTTQGFIAATPTAQPIPNDRYEIYDPMARHEYTQGNGMDSYGGEEESVDQSDRFVSQQATYELPQPDEFGPPPSPGGPPPLPPAHGSRHGTSHVSPAPAMESHGSYGFPSDLGPSNPYNTPPQDMHRHSMPAYTQRNPYQPYNSPADEEQFRKSANEYQYSPPRHHSYDSRYNGDYGSMQPTVEDAPSSPAAANYSGHRGSGSSVSHYDEPRYDQVPSPAPLNLSGKGSAASGRNSTSTAPSHQYSSSSIGYASNSSSFRDPSQISTEVSSNTSYSTIPHQTQPHRRQSEDQMPSSPGGYGLPPVPPTLVAGMDPLIAQEISDRIYDEKRASISQSAGNSPRGRYHNSPHYQPNRPHPLSYHEAAGVPFVPAAATYDDRQSRFSTATTVPIVKPRAISPNTQAPIRKSVSPSPGASDGRRLSGIPFGPDSYNALNSSLSDSTSTPSLSSRYDTKEIDPDAKIITHDGREIDPSDHIPESNYAPLLESKGPKYASQLPDRHYRPPPTGSNTAPNSGRRPLKQVGRPQSMAASSPIYMNSGPADPSTPPNGRNRLQKKTNRMSAHPAPHSSPLGPITPYQDNSYTPRSLPRAKTSDFNSNENYPPNHYGASPGYRSTAVPPPLPAKVPMGMGGPPPHQSGEGDAWALVEEMKNIDLGGGRSRRRGY
jgi:hypothetical protein